MNWHNSAALAILVALIGSAPVHAQSVIQGRVLDAEGKPAPNLEVLLHAISESSGSQVDKDTSRIDGRFELQVSSVDSKSIYFVAVSQNGQLFMGDMLRPPFPAGQEYIVRVGVNPVDFSAGTTTSAPAVAPAPAGGSRSAGAFVIVIAAFFIAGIAFVAMRRRPPEHRRLLVELARLEDEIGTSNVPNATLEKRRSELRNRLLDRSSG